jgi:hypothetical protein
MKRNLWTASGVGALLGVVAATGGTMVAPPAAEAQWTRVYEQTYLPARHNWAFRRNYNSAERLFYAFDYGHAVLYETLWTRPNAPVSLLEEDLYDRLTKRVLVRPPHLPLEEGALLVNYSKLAPEAKVMFDWAHVLHRQVYDVWADEGIPLADKDARVAELLAYYRSRPDVAISSTPKSMDLMDGQYYSLAFRERYPKYNGLIWSYHWLQVALYEPLMLGRTTDERQALVRGTVTRFWQMLGDGPNTMPYLMPMTAAVAPTFSARYPEIAIIFDNLHMMHDVISDVLASPEVPRSRKREEIIRAARYFQDDTSYVTSVDEWRRMAIDMGLNNQGGAAVGFLPDLPTPTVPRGMSMADMEHTGVDHSGHGAAPSPAADPHAGHGGGAGGMPGGGMMEMDPGMHGAMEFILRLLSDPQVESRIHADPALHGIWADPAVQRHLEMMREMHGAHGGQGHAPSATPADPHAGHGTGTPAPATGAGGHDPGAHGAGAGGTPAPHDMAAMHAAMGAHDGHDMAAMHGAMELIVRLLADPQVERRIHADPELHEVWSDSRVQEHLEMMREMTVRHGADAPPGAAPEPSAPTHQH